MSFARLVARQALRRPAIASFTPRAPNPSFMVLRGFGASMEQIKTLRTQTAAPIGDCKKAIEASNGDMKAAFEWLRKRGAAKASDLEGREAAEGLVAVAATDNEAAVLQVTCETDFSSRNETFQAFAAAAAQTCFDKVPLPPAPGVHPVTLEALLQMPMGGSDSSSPTINIGESLAELVGKIRESISVKAAAKVVAFQGVVGTYVHGATAQHPTVGSAAAVVSLSSSEPLDEAQTALLKPYAKRLAMHVVAAKPRYVDETSIPASTLEAERAILTEQALASGKKPEFVDKMVEGRLKKFYAEVSLVHQLHMVEPDSPPVSAVLVAAGKEVGGATIIIDGFELYQGGK